MYLTAEIAAALKMQWATKHILAITATGNLSCSFINILLLNKAHLKSQNTMNKTMVYRWVCIYHTGSYS